MKPLKIGFKKNLILTVVLATLIFASIAGALANIILPPQLLLNIYIRSDGSIDPSTAPIQRIGNVYVFTGNLLDYSIIVQLDNIVIDGAGYSLMKLRLKGGEGVVLEGRSNVTIKNLRIQGFHYGIAIKHSSYINVVENCIWKTYYAISLECCSYVNIARNVVCNIFSFGINLWASNNTYIFKNRIENSSHGMGFWSLSNKNTIIENHIANNNLGIWLSGANNTIYHNNFINNAKDLHIDHFGFPELYSNFLDNGAEGNYWRSYDGVDEGEDGIGDTPRIMNAYNVDHYPLMNPFIISGLPEPPEGTDTEPSYPLFAMPEEYINYTITWMNGSLWARVDGTYHLYKIFGTGESYTLNGVKYVVLSDELPMLYPVPPGATNISVKFNEIELDWSNYTETHHDEWRFTVLGWWTNLDPNFSWWPVIYFKVDQAPNNFTLKIRYEHPIPIINGNYTLLYLLDVSPYLSPWYNKSVAYFNIRIEATNYTILHAYTAMADKWDPLNYMIANARTAKTVSIKIISEYNKPLPGDLIIIFGENLEDANSGSSLGLSLEKIITIVAGTAAFIAFAGYGLIKRKRAFMPKGRETV